jgi:hypothetical protein
MVHVVVKYLCIVPEDLITQGIYIFFFQNVTSIFLSFIYFLGYLTTLFHELCGGYHTISLCCKVAKDNIFSETISDFVAVVGTVSADLSFRLFAGSFYLPIRRKARLVSQRESFPSWT